MMVCTEGNTNRECSFFLGWDGGDLWDGGFRWMEMNKKSGSWDVRAKALAWDDEWDEVKNDCKGTAVPLVRLCPL